MRIRSPTSTRDKINLQHMWVKI